MIFKLTFTKNMKSNVWKKNCANDYFLGSISLSKSITVSRYAMPAPKPAPKVVKANLNAKPPVNIKGYFIVNLSKARIVNLTK